VPSATLADPTTMNGGKSEKETKNGKSVLSSSSDVFFFSEI
jgi:hypothetical protein